MMEGIIPVRYYDNGFCPVVIIPSPCGKVMPMNHSFMSPFTLGGVPHLHLTLYNAQPMPNLTKRENNYNCMILLSFLFFGSVHVCACLVRYNQ
jgi:hypothetical protein